MVQLSGEIVNSDVFSVEENVYHKTTLRKKPHRTVVKGLKLLNEMFKTIVDPNNDFSNFPPFKQEKEIPHDLFTYEILARLPIKCLLQLKSVSKDWYSTVSSYEFANVHFKNRFSCSNPSSPIECLFVQVGSKFYLFYIQEKTKILDYCLVKLEPNFDKLEENDVQLVGSCNGLVCLANSSSSADNFYIWNPVTYQSRKFSDPCFMSNPCNVSWGFAYVSSLDDYKVVKIVQDYDLLETIILVFSFRSQEWKRVHNHGLDTSLCLTKTGPGVMVNDSLYWIMVSRRPLEKRVVVRFNLTLEKFEEVSGLVPRETNPKEQFLCVLGGCLSLYSLNVRNEAFLSTLKQPEEVESVRVSISDKWACSGLVGSTRTGRCFVVSKGLDLAFTDLDASHKYVPLVTLEQGELGERACVVSYIPSLISPFSIRN